jgi:Putative Ig domain
VRRLVALGVSNGSAEGVCPQALLRDGFCWLRASIILVVFSVATGCGGGNSGGSSGGTSGGTAPSFTSANQTTFTVGTAGDFSVSATGSPAPSIQVSGTLPAGVTFVDNGGGRGTLSGTPGNGTASDYSLTFTAINGTAPNAAQSFSLTVSAANNPGVSQLVQHVSGSNTRDNSFGGPYCYHYQLPNMTTAGNAVVVGFTFSGNPTPTVKDDQGDAYTVEVNHYDSTDTQSIGIATAFSVVAGARVISVCFSSDPGGFVQPMATEFDNVVAVDGAGVGAQGTGTTVAAGSMTPTVSGDLAYQVVYSLSTNQSSFTGGTQSNIGWSLLSADLMDGWAAQYGTYSSTSAISPTMSMGTSEKWLTAAVLLKTGTAGGVPSGMRILHLVHENLPVTTYSGGTGNPFPNPTTLQFPSSGNLLVAVLGGGLGCTVTGMTDTNHNTWSQAGTAQIAASGNDTVQTYYAGNATTSGTLGVTLNWSVTDGDFTILLYDVTGAATSPFDTTAGSNGNQTGAGNLTMPFTLTPAGANELIFTDVIWDYNTAYGLGGGYFDSNMFDGESQSGPEPIDENNGWGHILTTSNAAVSFTWTVQFGGLPVQYWAGMATAFRSAP